VFEAVEETVGSGQHVHSFCPVLGRHGFGQGLAHDGGVHFSFLLGPHLVLPGLVLAEFFHLAGVGSPAQGPESFLGHGAFVEEFAQLRRPLGLLAQEEAALDGVLVIGIGGPAPELLLHDFGIEQVAGLFAGQFPGFVGLGFGAAQEDVPPEDVALVFEAGLVVLHVVDALELKGQAGE
jgi:hypothetical protein